MRRILRTMLILLAAIGLIELPASVAAPSIPLFSHVFIILLENKDYGNIINNPSAPYLSRLAHTYGVANQYYAIAHPSQPNYIALTSGSTFTVTTDCTSCYLAKSNLVDQLEAAGKTWKGYMESMPVSPTGRCFLGDAGNYVQRHNPFVYYMDTSAQHQALQTYRVLQSQSVYRDITSNPTDYIWITPNLCNDMHNKCSDDQVKQGDTWLESIVPDILRSQAWRQNGVLFITFDESESDATCCGPSGHDLGGRIPTLVISPLGKPGFSSQVAYDHYSLLRTIEMSWNLPLLRKASSAKIQPMSDFFH